jgi:hypothetical protein
VSARKVARLFAAASTSSAWMRSAHDQVSAMTSSARHPSTRSQLALTWATVTGSEVRRKTTRGLVSMSAS